MKRHLLKVKPFRESAGMCGPASLKIVLDYYGVKKSEKELAVLCKTKKDLGTSNEASKNAAEIKRELGEIKNTESLEKEIEEARRAYKKKIKNPSFELKRHIVVKWIQEINIRAAGTIKIKARIPRGDNQELKIKRDFVYEGSLQLLA